MSLYIFILPSILKFDCVNIIGLLHLIPVPPCRGPHFPRGKLVIFSKGVIGKNGRKMLFPEGLKSKNALPEGVQVSSRGVNYTDFFAFQRGKIPKSRGPRQGGFGFLI